MTTREKSTAFEVVLMQETALPQYDIVIVHPFYIKRNPTKSLSDAFSGLQNRLSQSLVHEKANIYIFSFKGKNVISGKSSVMAVSNELLRRLGQQRATVSVGSHDSARFQSEARNGKFDKCKPYLMFIAHSLGCWIVKNVLLQNNQPNVSIFKTQGTIFLDRPITEQFSVEYLLSLSRLLSSQKAKASRDIFDSDKELVRELMDIDKTYKTWVESHYVQEERRKDRLMGIIPSENYDLWMSMDAPETGSTESPAIGSKGLFRYFNKIINISRTGNTRTQEQKHINLPLDSVIATWIHDTNELLSAHEPLRESITAPADSEPSTSIESGHTQDHPASHIRPQSPLSFTPSWFRPKRQSTLSSDTAVKSDWDRASIGSVPNLPSLQSDDGADELRQNINIGKSFVRKGELGNAETAFQRASALLNSKFKSQQHGGYSLELEVQLACITLYRGKYAEALRKFEVLRHSPIPEKALQNQYTAVICRWIGVALLYQGRYEPAAAQFRLILTQFAEYSSDEVQIRRDLALASAYLGNFHEAFGELKNAFDCLKILEQCQALERDTLLGSTTPQTEARSTHSTYPSTASRPPNIHHRGQASSEKFRQSLPTRFELNAQRDGLYFTQAKIGLAWGSFDRALKDSEEALLGMKKRLGPAHLKTLECASLNAILLALNSQTRAAETACLATHRAMTTELGHEHPLTLEAMGYLVRIYQMQSRFLEAVDTAKSLAQIVKSTQTENQPQALQSRCMHADSELRIGDYRSAESELEIIVRIANEQCKDNRLENLHHQTTLALAYHHCGKHNSAETQVGQVLRDQLKIYVTRHTQGKHTFDKRNEGAEDMTNQVAMLISIASLEQIDRMITALIDGGFIPIMRPPILRTLWVISLILREKDDTVSCGTATKLLQALWDGLDHESQADSQDALRIRFDLALAIRHEAETETSDDDGAQRLEESAKHLRHVSRARSRILGPTHPETLSANLELIITNFTLGRWETMTDLPNASGEGEGHLTFENQEFCALDSEGWALVQSESRKISELHEAQLGESHPETLKSLMRVLTIQILLGNSTAARLTSEKTLKRLRSKAVRNQRIVDSINLERKLASIVIDVDKQWADDILKKTQGAVLENRMMMLPEMFQMLKNMVDEDLRRLGDVDN